MNTSILKFTDLQSPTFQRLEKEIVYLFDVPHPEKMVEQYMKALECLEAGKDQDTLNHLKLAYREVKEQRGLTFSERKAANFEHQLIQSQVAKKPTETIMQIMINLYQEVFQSQNPIIETIAYLRTFLYQYKIHLLRQSSQLDLNDINLLKRVDARSKELLRTLW